MSVAVAPRYCGATGKRANCQVAVSVHAAGDTASCPLQWRLFLPKEWDADTGRRTISRRQNLAVTCAPSTRPARVSRSSATTTHLLTTRRCQRVGT
ncbi:hypothetical protein SRO_0186 [Streptomyces rochei]|nr:hypothetical protein SRO_0186 [Streptomyces rochei]